MKITKPSFRLFFLALCFWQQLLNSFAQQVDAKFYAIQVSASVSTIPPAITLNWLADPFATSYTVSRKGIADRVWGESILLPGSATSFSDTGVNSGRAYEYKLTKETRRVPPYEGYGYICVGIEAPLQEFRGKLILIVENTYAGALGAELERLEQDLIGDGWTVIRKDVNRNDSPQSVKTLIRTEYQADPANTKALFLFGRVPVAYSGDFAADGHANHKGAWPADVYYGEMDGDWTDATVSSSTAEKQRNWNVPGDGKFDQSELPSDVDLQIGRVDLSNMTAFSNKNPPRFEKDLLKQYLDKNHNFRHGRIQVERRALICDSFGVSEDDPVAASGWRNFAAFFGADKIVEVGKSNYFPTVRNQSFLWSQGTGGGTETTSDGIGSANDFATTDIRTVFTMFVGSYFGDWDNESNFLRAPLGSTSYTLTCAYSGFPQWYFHHMAVGETIGFSTRLTQNNGFNGLYPPFNHGTREVHIALMGDPTLRMHPVAPPSNLRTASDQSGVVLQWDQPEETGILGYYVYRSDKLSGPYQKVSGRGRVINTSFKDNPPSGTYSYMVRAIRLEQSASGSYQNLSQGLFSTINHVGGSSSPTPPIILSGGSIQNGSLQFELNGAQGQKLIIERSSNLMDWIPVSTNMLSGQPIEFRDPENVSHQQRFFRARASQ